MDDLCDILIRELGPSGASLAPLVAAEVLEISFGQRDADGERTMFLTLTPHLGQPLVAQLVGVPDLATFLERWAQMSLSTQEWMSAMICEEVTAEGLEWERRACLS